MQKIMFNDQYRLTEAVLEGRKTQTRRICKYSRPDESYDIVFPIFGPKDYDDEGNNTSALNYAFGWRNDEGVFTGWNKPHYKVGEIVAVAQSYKDLGYSEDALDRSPKDWRIVRGTLGESKGWNNKMFVRAEACVHQIKITNVRIQRLQDISDEDCLAEGIITRWHAPCSIRYYYITDPDPGARYDVYSSAREAYATLIDKVSGKGTWESNPWVFVYEFELVK